MGPHADLFGAIRGPYVEENLAAVGTGDFRMARDFAAKEIRPREAECDEKMQQARQN